MESESAKASYSRLHEIRQWHNGNGTSWAEKGSPEHPFHRDAGTTIGVADTDLKPWDLFTTRETAPFEAVASSATEAEADEHEAGDPQGDNA